MSEPLIFGVAVAPSQEVTVLDWGEVKDRAAKPRSDSFLWLHMDALSEETTAWLKANNDIPTEIAIALVAEETRPRYEEIDGDLLVNFRGINLNPGADPEDMVSLRAWLTPYILITTRRRPLMAIKDLQAMIETGWKPQSTTHILVELAGRLTARMDGVVQSLEESVDEIEAATVDGEFGTHRGLVAQLRRSAIQLRRHVGPQREALNHFASSGAPFVQQRERVRLRGFADHLTRNVEELDAVRDRGAILNDQIVDLRAEAMNRNMLVLSIVAAIFLPLGFLTGLLGINVGGIPGANYPWAFWFVFLGLGGIGVGLLAFFRHLKWL